MALEKERINSVRPNKHLPFNKREIQEIVQLIESGVPRRDIIAKYGMHIGTLSVWMKRYGSADHQMGHRVYSPTEKRTILRSIASGMTIREVCIAFGIKSKTTVITWLKQEQVENNELSKNASPVVSSRKEKSEEPAAEIQTLQAQLEQARLKIQALETMIDIAQEKLGVDIRKKSGAKQSAK